MKEKRLPSWVWLIITVLAIELSGMVSALLAGDIRGKYEAMRTPIFSPPGWVFGVVWPVLYLLMGIAVYIAYRKAVDRRTRQLVVILFAAQLLVNFIWSPVFFGNNLLWIAFIIIALLDLLVAACVILFFRVNKFAGIAMIPYFIWICFATYLNLFTAILN